MKKYLFIICVFAILLVGCTSKTTSKTTTNTSSSSNTTLITTLTTSTTFNTTLTTSVITTKPTSTQSSVTTTTTATSTIKKEIEVVNEFTVYNKSSNQDLLIQIKNLNQDIELSYGNFNLGSENYTYNQNGLYLKASFLKTLSYSKHEFTINGKIFYIGIIDSNLPNIEKISYTYNNDDVIIESMIYGGTITTVNGCSITNEDYEIKNNTIVISKDFLEVCSVSKIELSIEFKYYDSTYQEKTKSINITINKIIFGGITWN